MSPEAEKRYHDLLRRVALKNGDIVRTDPSIYGWLDYSATKHVRSCTLSSIATPEEIVFQEFAGTFATSDYTRHAIEVNDVSCECGTIRDRALRWETTVADALKIVLITELEKDDE